MRFPAVDALSADCVHDDVPGAVWKLLHQIVPGKGAKRQATAIAAQPTIGGGVAKWIVGGDEGGSAGPNENDRRT